MRLQVNLIPAIAYALVTMFSNISGLTAEVAQPAKVHQQVFVPARHQKADNQHGRFWVAKNGQVILSNDFGSEDMVWTIPYTNLEKDLRIPGNIFGRVGTAIGKYAI